MSILVYIIFNFGFCKKSKIKEARDKIKGMKLKKMKPKNNEDKNK